jgi:hypothetical protein
MLVLLMNVTCTVRRCDFLSWLGTHTEIYDDRFRHSIAVKVITCKISEAGMLALLVGGIYELRCSDDLKWHVIHTRFRFYRFWYSSNIKVISYYLN